MTLYAGPWCGEFGHEIMSWQANVRREAEGHNRVVVACVPSSRALYADFATSYWDVPPDHNTTSNRRYDSSHKTIANKFRALAQKRRGSLMDAKVLHPRDGRFVRYGKAHDGIQYDVVVHARDMVKGSKGGDRRRCAPREFWEELGEQLHKATARVACVGLSGCSLILPHASDLRDAPLNVTMDVLASSSCIVGPSSGPIHLAALCGCPQVVWTDTKHRGAGGSNNTQRLQKTWNPFSTAVRILHTSGRSWIPDLDEVFENIEELIDAQTGPDAATYDQPDPLGAG